MKIKLIFSLFFCVFFLTISLNAKNKESPKEESQDNNKEFLVYQKQLAKDFEFIIKATGLFYFNYTTGKSYDNSHVNGDFDGGVGFGIEIDSHLFRLLNKKLILGVSLEYANDPAKNMVTLSSINTLNNVSYTYGAMKYDGSNKFGGGIHGLWTFSKIPYFENLFTGLRFMAYKNTSDLVFVYHDYINEQDIKETQTRDAMLFALSGLIEAPVFKIGVVNLITRFEIGYQFGSNGDFVQNGLNLSFKAGVGF